MIKDRRGPLKRRITIVVVALTFPALASVVPPASAKNTNYATRARALVEELTNATTDDASFDALIGFFETANVTVVGERNGSMQPIHQGFGLSTQKDFFMMEESVLSLASAFREGTTASISELSSAVNLFIKPKASAQEMAQAMIKWVKFGRKQATQNPTSSKLLFPYFIDLLAKKHGVDLARARPQTEIPGLAVYLALTTLAPQKSALASPNARARARAFDPCGMLNEFSRSSGVGAAITRGLGWVVGLVKKAVVKVGAPLKVIDSLRGAAVALMTSIAPTPESIPLGGPTDPLHWRHFDEPEGQSGGTPDPKKYELVAKSDIPISESASNCMELLGIDVPAEGATRADIPVIWWLDDGVPEQGVPEISGQRLFDQGEWEYVGPNAGGIPGISDAAKAVSSKLPVGGQIIGLGATDSSGESTTEFTPRDEEGPYEGTLESFVEGKLRAFPLTGGLGSPAEVGASVISAITKRLEWSVKVDHHVKLAWTFDAAPASWAIPCDGEECPVSVQWQVSGVRCQFPGVDTWWDPSLTQVPIDGLWFAQWFQSYDPGFVFTQPTTFQVGKVGETGLMGTPDNEFDPREVHGFLTTRLPDDPSKAQVRLEYYDSDGEGGIVKYAEYTADITPISQATELEALAAVLPSATGCVPKETIRTR